MRHHAKIDANQPEIVAALRKAGCSVQSLASIGHGAPDLLVGRHGQNYLLEVKDGDKPVSRRSLTPLEKEWIDTWKGEVFVVTNTAEAFNAVGIGVVI
jgi:hypothetical protein